MQQRELLVKFAIWLCETQHNATAQLLVKKTRIFILPIYNPDGFDLGTRENANGVDLNRDFPDHIRDPKLKVVFKLFLV